MFVNFQSTCIVNTMKLIHRLVTVIHLNLIDLIRIEYFMLGI